MKTSKSPFNHSILKTASLLVSLGLVSGNVAIAKAGSDRLVIGPERPRTFGYGTTSGEGYLFVYSATGESSDGDLAFYPHSSYVIYTGNGKFVKNVENHMSRGDELPELVRLAPGFYTVEPQSAKDGYVRIQVVIKAGRRTILDLE